MKNKFNVGDRVRVLDKFSRTLEGRHKPRVAGKTGKILAREWNISLVEFDEEIGGHDGEGRGKDGFCWWVQPEFLELLEDCKTLGNEQRIIIERCKNEVLAFDRATAKYSKAVCSPEDEFDFYKGAKLAFERLMEQLEEKPITAGDFVRVKDVGRNYSTYSHWSGLKGYYTNYVLHKRPETNKKYIVLRVKEHDSVDEIRLALIQNPDTAQVFIINVEGLERV